MSKQSENQPLERLAKQSVTEYVADIYENPLYALTVEKLSSSRNSAATTLEDILIERELAGYVTNVTVPPTPEPGGRKIADASR